MIDDLAYEYKNNIRCICMVGPCGCGKTVLVAWMAAATALRKRRVLFLVHRQELIDQSSETFTDMNITHGIIATKQPKQYERMVQIGSVQTVVRRLGEIPNPDYIIIDECFVAGTMVDNKPIESIKVGDAVPCFDDNGLVHYRIVTRLFKNPAPSTLIEIAIGDRKIICTPNHPIFTPSGWMEAKNIAEGNELYVRLPKMRRSDEIQAIKKMPNMLQTRHGGTQQDRSTGENANQQSNETGFCEEKSQQSSSCYKSQAENKRWQRTWAYKPAAASCGTAESVKSRIGSANKNAKGFRVSNLLQDRPWQRASKNWSRNRRKFALRIRASKAGPQEREFLTIARVDHIKVYEQSSHDEFKRVCPDGYVYNIEVAEHHTYFANDIAVHNCHHVLASTYRKILDHYPNAQVLGVTATPERMGGQGLGDVFSSMTIGPSVKDLIEWGNLAPFDLYAPPVKFDASQLRVKFGDYVREDLQIAMDDNTIIGDLIESYHKYAEGLKAIVYCVSLQHSEHVARSFRNAGIAAQHIDGETPKPLREQIIKDFRSGRVQILCNVDLISEGFDVPSAGAVILARPTQSLTLYIQQAMRAMRPDENNPDKRAIIIDHVGNVFRHGMPDEERDWTLESKKKRKISTQIIRYKSRFVRSATKYIALQNRARIAASFTR